MEDQLMEVIAKELRWRSIDQHQFPKEVTKVLVFSDHIEIVNA